MALAPKVNISPSKGWNVQKPQAQFSRVSGKQMKVPQINKPKAVKKLLTPKGKKPLSRPELVADSEGYTP